MGIEAGKRDGSPKVSFAAARQWFFGDLIKVELSLSKVDNKNTSTITTEQEILSFDVPVDKAAVMDLSDAKKHFNQNLDHNFKAIALLKTPPSLEEVDSE